LGTTGIEYGKYLPYICNMYISTPPDDSFNVK